MKYISLVFLIGCTVLFAGEKTGTKYFLNAGLNYNIHSADLKGFSGSENCCDKFSGGNFLDPTFGFGMELALGNLLFELPANYVVQLNYNGMSSEYSEERFRGYKLSEFGKEAIMVEHQLNPTIKLLSIDNSVYNELFNGFSFGVGVGLGFVASANYTQNEIAISPSDFTFSNGKREINTASGTIEEMNSIIISLFTGIRYDLYSTDNWTLRPELKYNYIPMSVLDGKDLAISQISGSISFVYNVTKSSPPPPPPPIEEPKEDTVVVAPPPPHIHVTLTLKDGNGNTVENGQNIDLPTTVYETRQEYALKPVVFFDSSDYNYKHYNIESFTNSDFDVQTEMIKSVAQKMKADSSLLLTLTTYDLKDEGSTVPQDRLYNIKSKLKEYGIQPSRVKESIIAANDDFKYNELKDEHRRVEFALSDQSDLIKSVYEIDSQLKYDAMTFVPTTAINSSRDDYYREATLQIDGKTVKTDNKDFQFEIDEAYTDKLKENGKLQVNYNTSAEVVGIFSSDNIGFTVTPKITNVKQTINTITDGTKTVEQYILAYTDFDKAELESIDQQVLASVRKALTNNQKVTIYASTDNLGNLEYNKALAERRANSAKTLIGSDSRNLQIVYPDNYLFSNEHPYGRMLNRAIVVRIEK
jgi:outer membrane protein OmpA-like peptidoglycan-associated protein